MIVIKYYLFRIILQAVLCYSIFFFVLGTSNTSYAEKKIAKVPSIEACEYVVSHANKGELNKILILSEPLDSSKIKKLENLPDFSGVVFKKLMDINNDGVLERVFVVSQGTAHYEQFSVFKLKTDEEIELKKSWDDNWSDDVERWAADRTFIQFKSVTYVLGKTDQSLHYLLYINPINEMKVMCEFGQRKQPLIRLKTSQNDKVCKQVLEGKIKYVEFNKLHSISHEVVRKAGFYETHPAEYAALVDINNEGKKEIVVPLELASGRGRGCGSTFLGVLTEDRSDIDKKFTEKLPGGGCGGTKVTPFVVDGKTYLDERQTGPHAEHLQVHILEKDKLKTICEFEVRPDNYVLGQVERIEKADEYQNIWYYAISQPGLETVKTLIESGRDVNEVTRCHF